jgi:hypothetical protein
MITTLSLKVEVIIILRSGISINDCYREPTELVQHFAYRESSYRCKGDARHVIGMVWQYRSPIPVARRDSTLGGEGGSAPCEFSLLTAWQIF